MTRYLQTQTECYWRACQALGAPTVQREVRDSAERLLKATAIQGASVKVRLRAIDALRRNGMPAPLTIVGGGDAA